MQVSMTITVEVDTEVWQRIYGTTADRVPPDVFSYISNAINQSPAAYTQAMQITTSRLHNRGAGEPGPEPPVGTEYHRDGVRIWVRREDGWHCGPQADHGPEGATCRHCPCGWYEVWDIGGIRDPRVQRRDPS